MTHLLDTNAWVEHIRGRNHVLDANIKRHLPSDLGLSAIVLAELSYGAYRSASNWVSTNLASIGRLRSSYPIVAFDEQCVDVYAQIRHSLTASGTPIGANDMLIAATALAHNLTLVTHNTREFGRVAGLKLEDWQV